MRGSHVIWERNPNYWNKELPYLDKLVARFVLDAAARTIAFETGDVDLGYRTPVPYRDVDRLKTNPKITLDEEGYEYDPPNIIIGSRAKLSFNDFLIHLAPVAIIALIALVAPFVVTVR